MNYHLACKILQISECRDLSLIKKQYRALMRLVHPDASPSDASSVSRAQELNAAYAYLCNWLIENPVPKADAPQNVSPKSGTWDAPVNPHAYCTREIFHPAETTEGNTLGYFSIASGKYLWTLQEDFSCFLKSLFLCSKSLLDAIDIQKASSISESQRLLYQAKLTYLLAQQFIDAKQTLCELFPDTVPEKSTFLIHAMIEYSSRRRPLFPGTLLFPAALKEQRLYLKDVSETRLGYLSFSDDRLYYILIPLFEQRVVQVKLVISDQHKKQQKRSTLVRYQNVDLYIRFLEEKLSYLPDSIQLKIEQLLQKYRQLFC